MKRSSQIVLDSLFIILMGSALNGCGQASNSSAPPQPESESETSLTREDLNKFEFGPEDFFGLSSPRAPEDWRDQARYYNRDSAVEVAGQDELEKLVGEKGPFLVVRIKHDLVVTKPIKFRRDIYLIGSYFNSVRFQGLGAFELDGAEDDTLPQDCDLVPKLPVSLDTEPYLTMVSPVVVSKQPAHVVFGNVIGSITARLAPRSVLGLSGFFWGIDCDQIGAESVCKTPAFGFSSQSLLTDVRIIAVTARIIASQVLSDAKMFFYKSGFQVQGSNLPSIRHGIACQSRKDLKHLVGITWDFSRENWNERIYEAAVRTDAACKALDWRKVKDQFRRCGGAQ